MCVKFENEQPFITRLYTLYTHSEYITSLIRFDHLQTTNEKGTLLDFKKRFREPLKDTYSSLHSTTLLL